MTNAEINRDIYEKIERKCLHKNEALYINCYWGSNAYYFERECLDCDMNIALVDAFRRESSFMDGVFPLWDEIPNYLADGNYILGLEEKLLEDGCIIDKRDGKHRIRIMINALIPKRITAGYMVIAEDESLRRAVALAAIRKEGGG